VKSGGFGRRDAAQLKEFAKYAKDEGTGLMYVFLHHPGQAAIDKIQKAGGVVRWFLD